MGGRCHFMKELIKLLDKNLKYESHEITNDEIHIQVTSKRKALKCPYCGKKSKKRHSTYKRTVQDMPICGRKVYIEINNRKMFCENAKCTKKTFSERYEFVGAKGKKTGRLEKEIINIALNASSTEAAKMLSRNTVKVSCVTVRNLLKKTREMQSTERE
jgi:transposase